MPASNRERQAAWRKRQQDEKKDVQKRLKETEAERDRLRAQKDGETARLRLAEMRRQRDEAREEAEELLGLNSALEREVKSLRSRLARAGDPDQDQLSRQTWDALASFDEKQLRQWVLAGQRFTEKNHDSPVENAVRWVIENRLRGHR